MKVKCCFSEGNVQMFLHQQESEAQTENQGACKKECPGTKAIKPQNKLSQNTEIFFFLRQ